MKKPKPLSQWTEAEKQTLRDENRRNAIEHELNTCDHYRGTWQKDACQAGVRFDAVTDKPAPGWGLKLPCQRENGVDNCPSRKFPTEEEAIERVNRSEARKKLVFQARNTITDVTGGRRNVSDSITCPACGGVLHYSIAFNGHCHASCQTKGCLSWME